MRQLRNASQLCSFITLTQVIHHASSASWLRMPIHFISPRDTSCNFSLVASHFRMFIHCSSIAPSQINLLPIVFFSSLCHFRIFIQSLHCSLGYPDPLEPFRSLFSIIQPLGNTSCGRRVRHSCHARCGIIMLTACRRCCSRAFLCSRGTPASHASLTIATEMTVPTIIMQ